jgi:hypothetical protein
LQTFITGIAYCPEILWRVIPAFGFVLDVSHRQTDWTWAAKWVGIAGRSTAHLARVTISLKDLGTGFFGDFAPESWNSLDSFKNVLSWLQVPPILMGKNLVTLFIAKFTNATCPLRCAAARLLNLPRF